VQIPAVAAAKKMNFVLATSGSRGDVQPMVALALRLREKGHSVRLCAPPNFKGWADHLELPFASVSVDMKALLVLHREQIARPFALATRLGGTLREDINLQFATLPAALAEADMLVGASLLLAGPSLAERNGIPYFHVVLCPQTLPSLEHPPPIIPFSTRKHSLNRLLWGVQRAFFNRLLGPTLNRNRARIGLGKIEDVFGYIGRDGLLVASDPELAPVPGDVTGAYVQTGSWRLAPSGELPDTLERFLDSGPPPIYIGFGSMTVADPAATTHLIIDALHTAGRRAVISRGWAGLGERKLPESCCLAGNVHHALLFPRVAVIVHHGGAGTVAAAARAGVPQIIVPHLLDQYYWADRLRRVGISPRSIPQTRLTAEKLTGAIDECLSDGEMKARAERMSRDLHEADDGLDAAIAHLESTIAGRSAVTS
jgi:UDP:flavonoid glycosyltransferase YjiC (YdhE family)